MTGIPSPRSGAGQTAADGTHGGGGSGFLGSGSRKDGGGFLHQSKNPRCSELRKSIRISQRIAPLPRLSCCQDTRSRPSGTQRSIRGRLPCPASRTYLLQHPPIPPQKVLRPLIIRRKHLLGRALLHNHALFLIHTSEPTRLSRISNALLSLQKQGISQ